jgi:hypothetical protein
MSSSSTPWRAEKHSWIRQGPHSRHFVGGNARTHTATADGHTAVRLAARNRTGQGHNKVRIVIVRLRLGVAKVDHFIASLPQLPGQILLQPKTSMIGTDTGAFRRG